LTFNNTLRLPFNQQHFASTLRSEKQLQRKAAALAPAPNTESACWELTSRLREEGEGEEKKEKLSACHGEGSAAGLQLRVRCVPAALLAMLRTALALQSVGLMASASHSKY
jgi:hypothetical protein